ncbi:MAG: twin-arginine translocase TatA/TatE family subunit [Dehalococcoidia bacterium]|nr:MAG: twin-arginine translocase TatA/TatE family subunit [Dehalococcoidia bacterium]
MEFFGMGPLEILLILIVGLIAFGPGKLPQMARNLGKGIITLKKTAADIKEDITKEFEELEEEVKTLSEHQEMDEDGGGKSKRRRNQQ